MKKITPLVFGLSIIAIIFILLIIGALLKNILSSRDEFKDKSSESQLNEEILLQNVVIISSKKTKTITDPTLEGLIGLIDSGRQKSRVEEVQQDVGTGFVMEDNPNLVVTNKHVVFDTEVLYSIFDENGNEYIVSKIYRDPDNDLAILQVDDFDADGLPLGDSDNTSVGDNVLVISKTGATFGEYGFSEITGVISGMGKRIEAFGKNKVGSGVVGIDSVAMESMDDAIQTNIAISPGDSGGPLINSKGEVIGVNVAIGAEDEVSYSIPINKVKSLLADLAL